MYITGAVKYSDFFTICLQYFLDGDNVGPNYS